MGSQSGKSVPYRLRLFVAGNECNSLRAISNLKPLLEERLKGFYELQIVDVFKDYQAAIKENVLVVPTLIIESPPPRKIIVGSLTDREKLLTALGLS